MATTTLSGVVTPGNSVKRDAGHLDALNDMDYEDSNKNGQVMSPTCCALLVHAFDNLYTVILALLKYTRLTM
eukprot:6067108-Amphidinium_carterae.2